MAKTWHCPSCDAAAQTVTDKIPWHNCPGVGGFTAPLVEDGAQKTRFVMLGREDYVGGEKVQTDNEGHPVMALDVQRWDGSNDRVVFAPTAVLSADAPIEETD